MMKTRVFAILGGLLFIAFSSTAQAALFEDDEARRAILDLRQRVETLRMSIEVLRADNLVLMKKGSEVTDKNQDELQVLRRSLLDLQNQIESLRSDLAKSQGANEALVKSLSEWQRDQKDKIQAQDDRLRKLEPIKVAMDGREFLAEPSEKREYDQALEVFRKGDYATALTMLADFVRRYTQSGYKASALFWLGNAQYAVKEYKDAMVSFRSLVALAPHPRVPESMLALANCHIELKDIRAARKAFEDLIKAHPESEAATAAKDRLARLK
jgi:tol-pal system protein YbgF